MTDRTDDTDDIDDQASVTEKYASTTDDEPVDALEAASLATKLQWGGLAVLVVVSLVTTVQFYGSTTRAIRVWVGPGYQPLFMAAFNLALLLVSIAGISTLVRRLAAAPS